VLLQPIGVELDLENYNLLKFNTRTITTCQILNAGIWNTDGEINYSGSDSQSFSINNIPSNEGTRRRAITISSLFTECKVSEVDYLKMDIEGAEAKVFLNVDITDWISSVKMLSIEIHHSDDYPGEELNKKIKMVLEKHGFCVYTSAIHWAAIFALKSKIQ